MGKPDLIDNILQEVFDLLAAARTEGVLDGLKTAATGEDHTESYVHSVETITPMLQELGGSTSDLEKAVGFMLADPVMDDLCPTDGDGRHDVEAEGSVNHHLRNLRRCMKALSGA